MQLFDSHVVVRAEEFAKVHCKPFNISWNKCQTKH